MKSIKLLFLISSLFAISCSNKKTHDTHVVSTLIRDTSILDTSKLQTDTNNLQVNKIDTFKYLGIHYWDTTMDRYDSAYIDTFTVDNCKFRFISPLSNVGIESDVFSNVYLEKYVNANWTYTGFRFSGGNHIGNYYHSRDVNGDGFIDLTQINGFVEAVYFYDPKTKNFSDTTIAGANGDDYINPDWTLIDTARKIFCDFQELKQMCGQIHSQLYTYNGNVRQNLYDLELYNCTETNDDTHLITKLILSKVGKRKYYDFKMMDSKDSLIDSKDIPLQTPIDLDKDYDTKVGYFDYVTFWKERYKDLLGYR